MKKYLGFDLGASSGRAIVGLLEKNQLKLDEIYRFSNGGIKISESLYWDVLRLYQKIRKGLRKYSDKYGSELQGIGIDTWGVSFVLLDKNDELVGMVNHYRDKRAENMYNEIFKIISKEEIFNQTGIQFMVVNSLVHLFSMVHNESPQLSITKTLLMLPDYFNFLLTGRKVSEYSIATTSQLFNPVKNDWAYGIIKKLGFKTDWFCKIIQSGTIIGSLKEDITEDTNLTAKTKLIAVLSHDTGSAVGAVPVDMIKYQQGEWAYLSAGTWCLIGVELDKPILDDKALNYNFTNEGGINNTIRFLKNITGLWIIQECKRIWDNEGLNLSWETITTQAKRASAFQYFIDPNDPLFTNPPDMINAIKEFCRIHNQKPPESVGEISRTVFESLAFKYREVLEMIEEIIGKKIKIIHIIGGGSKNELLNQFTANILNIPAKAGPSEATVIGNILVQALALGDIKDVTELRNVVINSFPIKEYNPENVENWNVGYKTYLDKIK